MPAYSPASGSGGWEIPEVYEPLPVFGFPLPVGDAHPVLAAVDAVPGRIADVAVWPSGSRVALAEQCADVISTGAGVMWYSDAAKHRNARNRARPKKPGMSDEYTVDEVAGALASGLAILAHRPCGVVFAGRHWCTREHADCGETEGGGERLPDHAVKSGTGTDYTPRELAQGVTRHTLEPLVYSPGPLQTADTSQWELLPPPKLAGLKTADIAVGCGVFAVAAVRFLAEHLVESWRQWEPADTDWEALPPILSGLHRVGHRDAHLTGPQRDVRGRLWWPDPHRVARQLALRCVYGVDVQAISVQLARTVLRLLVPLDDVDVWIDRRTVCGDSLLGVTSLEQVRHMHLDPQRGAELHDDGTLFHQGLYTDEEWAQATEPVRRIAQLAAEGVL